MNASNSAALVEVLTRHRDTLLGEWLSQHLSVALRRGLTTEAEMGEQFRNFLNIFSDTLKKSDTLDASRPEWEPVRAFLADVSAHRARQGFTPVETATFVFSLKQPLYKRLREEYATKPEVLADVTCCSTRSASSRRKCSSAAAKRSSRASRKNCSNCRRPSCNCGTAFSRCR
jgi:rsbT co-antagonist protein RsbR